MGFGDGTLFRDLGETLQQVGETVVSDTVSSLKTAIARTVVKTQEGNAVAQQEVISSWLPIAVLGIIGFFIIRRFVR